MRELGKREERKRERVRKREGGGGVTCRDPITWQTPLQTNRASSWNERLFFKPGQDLIQTYKRLACCRNYHRSDLFSASFQSLSHRLHQSLYWSRTDFQYMTAASIALTKLPFCYNNSPNRYSINVAAHWFFTCLCYMKWELHPGNMSDPLFKAVCVAGPFIRTLHSCWSQLHHMPSANPILSISHPIPGSFSKQKKKKKEKPIQTLLSRTEQRWNRQLYIHLLFILFILTVILSNWWGSSLVTAGLQ